MLSIHNQSSILLSQGGSDKSSVVIEALNVSLVTCVEEDWSAQIRRVNRVKILVVYKVSNAECSVVLSSECGVIKLRLKA